MAGIEQLEIHSKVRSVRMARVDGTARHRLPTVLTIIPSQSYIVRWVRVDDGHTISWSVQPHKKSMYDEHLDPLPPDFVPVPC